MSLGNFFAETKASRSVCITQKQTKLYIQYLPGGIGRSTEIKEIACY